MREYELIRSRRKSVSLEIKELCLKVRAPLNMPKRDIDRFVQSREDWIEKHLDMQARRMAAHPEPSGEEKAALIRRAELVLPEKVRHYAAIMGVEPSGVRITGAKTRFGSCSARHRLCFSWRLMQYPEEAVDYVVVHELAHILHMDHSREFYACVEKFMPDHKARRKMLKE